MKHDVAAVLVNFNSGRLCRSAVASLQAQEFTGRDGKRGSLQIIVVDNASPIDQHAELEPLKALGCTVIYHDQNAGYGAGMNLGMRFVDAEFVLIANPDILVLDGALAALVGALREDDTLGAVGPRGYLDPDLFICLPPNDLPSLALHAAESLGRRHGYFARTASHARSRRFRDAWLASRPRRMDMISGFAMLLRSELARRLGPFDPRFPFYFEDADLCRRVRRAGLGLALVPAARMIHFFDQSARSVRQSVTERYHLSRAFYYRKHYGPLGSRLFRALEKYAGGGRPGSEGWRFVAIDELGEHADVPLIDVPASPSGADAEWLMEIATDPAFLFCGGHPGRGPQVVIAPRAWNALEATRWYVRVIDPRTLAIRRAVTFTKTRPATGPVSFDEFRAIGASR